KIISSKAITITMTEQDLQSEKADETLRVKNSIQLFPSRPGVRCLEGVCKLPTIESVFELPDSPGRFCEVELEKVFGESFCQYIKSQSATVQFNESMGHSRCWEPSSAKEFAAELFVDVGRVFDGIVQVNLLKSVESPTSRYPTEVE